MLAALSWIIVRGQTTIWEGDGWTQHIKALIYYARYLRSFIRKILFDHSISMQEWDFRVGEGADVLGTFHYYGIGDPICLLAVFIPTKYMHYGYAFLTILRAYISGLAFFGLCFGTGIRNRTGILSGAMTYVFCTWGIYNLLRHPFFLIPMMYLPLIILGVEKIIRRESARIFIISVVLACVSQFYFFYMIVVFTVIYVLVRLLVIYGRDWLKIITEIGRIAVYSVLSACMSAVVLLPVLYVFLSDSRIDDQAGRFQFVYPWIYYSRLLSTPLLSAGAHYQLFIGISAPGILGLLILFKRKDSLTLRILAIISFIIMLVPAVRVFSVLTEKDEKDFKDFGRDTCRYPSFRGSLQQA